jgi:hypothetical protein
VPASARACHALLLAVLGFAVTAPASAEDAQTPAPPPEWEFSFAPYLWATSLEGTVEAEGASAGIDVAFSDIWDALDVGLLGSFEARHGKLSLQTNLIYLKLSEEADEPVSLPGAPLSSLTVRTTMQTGIFELRPAWEVLSLPLFGAADERRLALGLGPAARVFWLDQHLDVKRELGGPSRFDESNDWVDFLAAARVRAQLSEKLGLVISGDYGGFDVGSSSHRTWSLQGFVSWALGEHWSLAGGWRTLEIDRGALDLELSGPLLGAVYRF